MTFTQTGTPFYASPEIWRDKPYDFKSDIWSIGIIIYEITMLKVPFKAEDIE
jgi:NIMA (never in mitosis gene a)-related kinase